jgi:hypothetical protein
MTSNGREALFVRYEDGPRKLRAAWEQVPGKARQWRPAEGKWSAHEVVVHCADSETISGTRIRFLIGEDSARIMGYDEAEWARRFDYHRADPELSLRQIEMVRAWTAAMIRGLPESAWSRAGTHSQQDGPYTASRWLELYAEHLEVHERQILRNLAAWKAR